MHGPQKQIHAITLNPAADDKASLTIKWISGLLCESEQKRAPVAPLHEKNQ
jgi:hypothetical protein